MRLSAGLTLHHVQLLPYGGPATLSMATPRRPPTAALRPRRGALRLLPNGRAALHRSGHAMWASCRELRGNCWVAALLAAGRREQQLAPRRRVSDENPLFANIALQGLGKNNWHGLSVMATRPNTQTRREADMVTRAKTSGSRKQNVPLRSDGAADRGFPV